MAKKKAGAGPSKKTNGDGPPEEPLQASGPAGAVQAAAAPGEATATQAQLSVLAQYVKDLSFESPNAPDSLQGPGQNPQLKVNVNVGVVGRSDEAFEVGLNLEVHAKSDAGVIYNVELVYGGLFRLQNVPQAVRQHVLFVDCPAILFPFMRRLLADVTRDGGFPPLMLDPIDFARLYAENLARGQAAPPSQATN